MKQELTIPLLCKEAKKFSEIESKHSEPTIYGTTDGKAVGTYLEHKFQKYLHDKYDYVEGSSAKGIDFPKIDVDMKVTSIKQPQSSCPFKSARQKIFGLGYSLLVFVYDKQDDEKTKKATLKILHTIYVDSSKTADFQMTSGIINILENDGNEDDLIGFFADKMLPVDEIEANLIAEELMNKKPDLGYLTISNALQWRLQYKRVIQEAGKIKGIDKVV